MSKILFNGKELNCQSGDTVLDCLEKAGEKIPNSCRSGVCLACVVQAVSGNPGEESQKGLSENQKQNGFFKSCSCRPKEDLEVSLKAVAPVYDAVISKKTFLNPKTILVHLAKPENFKYKSGQFINLTRPSDGLMRSYSVASQSTDSFIELHIRLYENGAMSSWLANKASLNELVQFSGPFGECFYNASAINQDLLLAGIGTGMAPLYGIAVDALRSGHKGKLTIIQGAMDEAGLYYVEEFKSLSQKYENCHYISSTVEPSTDHETGKIDAVVKQNFPSLKNHQVYLCGSPNTVNRLKRYSFLAGASMNEIYCDAFTEAAK